MPLLNRAPHATGRNPCAALAHAAQATVLSLCATLAWAGPTTAPVRAEIDALLARLQASGCQFERNGSWYPGAEAKTHLLRKLDYIDGKSGVQSTEQFIELAATQSSASGKVYRVQCQGAAAVPSSQWLREQLTQLRGRSR